MAIKIDLTHARALITAEARQRQTYDGRGDDRRVTGRATDEMGRPLSAVAAVVLAEPMGLLPEAQVQLPDIQAVGLKPGMVITIDGAISARLSGGDYASIRATVTGERMTVIGDFTEWVEAATAQKQRPEAKAS